MSRSNNFLKVLIIFVFLFFFVVNLAITLDKAFADIKGKCVLTCNGDVEITCPKPCSIGGTCIFCEGGTYYK